MGAHEAFEGVQRIVRASALDVKDSVPDKSISAGGERHYDLAILIILLILVWPVGLIYYFTREKNSISVTVTPTERVHPRHPVVGPERRSSNAKHIRYNTLKRGKDDTRSFTIFRVTQSYSPAGSACGRYRICIVNGSVKKSTYRTRN
jgi:hypothetical protein